MPKCLALPWCGCRLHGGKVPFQFWHVFWSINKRLRGIGFWSCGTYIVLAQWFVGWRTWFTMLRKVAILGWIDERRYWAKMQRCGWTHASPSRIENKLQPKGQRYRSRPWVRVRWVNNLVKSIVLILCWFYICAFNPLLICKECQTWHAIIYIQLYSVNKFQKICLSRLFCIKKMYGPLYSCSYRFHGGTMPSKSS
jgi:hypothetical protein